jgi:hypothetical protein
VSSCFGENAFDSELLNNSILLQKTSDKVTPCGQRAYRYTDGTFKAVQISIKWVRADMAIVSMPVETVITLRYQTGMVDGSPVIRQKNLSGLKTDVSDEDIYEVAAALFNLLEYPLVSVSRNDRSDLIQE